MSDLLPKDRPTQLHEANALMIEALQLLDRTSHPAAARLDQAIVALGLRDENLPSIERDMLMFG